MKLAVVTGLWYVRLAAHLADPLFTFDAFAVLVQHANLKLQLVRTGILVAF